LQEPPLSLRQLAEFDLTDADFLLWSRKPRGITTSLTSGAFSMSDASSQAEGAVTCPLCGSTAEQGCVYGADGGLMRWYLGPPGFYANFATGLGEGDPVGGTGYSSGPHAAGIRCRRCRRIILEY
jgi:hypothetical protein